MKLTKNARGVYVATYKTPHGSRTISTKCKDRKQAEKVAKEAGISEMEMAAKAGRLTREVIGQIVTGKKLTVEKATIEWQKWLESIRISPKTISNNVTIVTAWMNESKLNNTPPSSVTEADISDWVNAESDRSFATRRIYLSAIRGFFKLCSARGWVVGDPSQAVRVTMDGLTHKQKEKTIRQVFNRQEVQRLIKTTRKQGKVFWEFAVRASYELGFRLGDICCMDWSSFAKPGRIVVWTDKRNKRVDHPLSSELDEVLCRIPVTDPTYLFPDQRATYLDPTRRATLSTAFTRICEREGIKGRSFHSLRHTAATEQFARLDKNALAKKLAEVLTTEQIQQLLGHSSAQTTKGYIH